MDVKYSADTKMADSKRAFEMQKAAFNQEINIKVCLFCATRSEYKYCI